MELFHNAKEVRLKSHHEKYLLAHEDEDSVIQDRNGSSKNARWTLEPVPGSDSIIRLKSAYNKYLTASNQSLLLGMTGKKVIQTLPGRPDSSVEWEPVRVGAQVKLKTLYEQFLRANGGLPPWRNSVTHGIPHRTTTQDWVLWDVDILEIQCQSPAGKPTASRPTATPIKFGNISRPRQETEINTSKVEMPVFWNITGKVDEAGEPNAGELAEAADRVGRAEGGREEGGEADEGELGAGEELEGMLEGEEFEGDEEEEFEGKRVRDRRSN